VPRAAAAQAVRSGQYLVETFGTERGLPSQAVTSMAQTSDGYLWIATGGILARFDGYVFQAYTARNAPLLSRRIIHIHTGLADTLWITDEGFGVLAFAGGRVTQVVPAFSIPVGSVAQSARGLLFAVGNDSAWLLREEDRPPSGALLTDEDRRPGFNWVDREGTPWLGFQGGVHLGMAVGASSHGAFLDLLFDPVTREGYRVQARGAFGELVDGRGRARFTYRNSPPAEPRLIDSHGQLWVLTASGTAIYAPGSSEPRHFLPQLGHDQVQIMLEDRSGCVWTARLAIHRACLAPFRSLPDGNAPRASVMSISQGPQQSVLLLNSVGLVTQAGPAGVRVLADGNPIVQGAFTDARETVWISRYALDPGGSNTLGVKKDGGQIRLPGLPVYRFASLPRRDDVMWMASFTHLYRVAPYAPGGPQVTDSVAHGAAEVTAMSITSNEVLWAVLKMPDFSAGLLRIERDRTTLFTPRDGLPAAALRAVLAEDDGTVWLGTYGDGLVRFRNGTFQRVGVSEGLAENIVTSVLEDDAGNFWMGGNRSIHRVPRAQVEAFLDGRATRVYGTAYGVVDGIRDAETSGKTGVRDAAGQFWFPTLGGAVIVDPAVAVALDSQPPLVHVLGITTDDDSIATDGWSTPLAALPRLSRGARRLEISYTGISMRNPDRLQYEYRIDDLDRDWIPARSARTAIYNEVGPGTHTFRVRAIGAGGLPSATEATLQFIVPAYFHETPLFAALVLATLGAAGWFGVNVRVRHLRRREAELTRQVEARTQKLGVALQTVAQQADELRALDEAKSRFFANVSHEFRTPLSLILGPVEDLRDGRAGPLPPAVRKRLENVVNNARRLLQLVEQLLDIARLESGKLHLAAEAHDLIPLVRRMADSFASLAEHRGIVFHLSCTVGGVRVRFDTDQMEKIISNLVGNALKFTPAGGTVQLRVSSEQAIGGMAIIEVEDSGPGIAPEHQQRVFERFYQIDDSARRAHGGVGIGLALVKELVELHGGTIALQSVPGSGCTFTARLPLAPGGRHSGEWKAPAEDATTTVRVEKRPAAHAPRPRRAAEDIVTVLVVEDNEDLLEFLAEHLAERFRVLSAPNGARGLEMARQHVPDLIISDVMMPEMDGQALCEAVKSDPEIDFVPVILLTAKASRDSRLTGLAGGADDYLTKPVDLTELVIRGENLIAARRRVRERYRAEQRDLPAMAVPFTPAARDASSQALLEKLYGVMLEHLADDAFDVERMASAMGMGRTTLYRRVEELLGRSPMEALWEYRLAQAAQWLGETEITVSEVAYGVGFKSVPHFCTRFRERYHETPSAYRRSRRGVADRT
jgi:signal transduction histidine kinase/AraC-like DNA-binding protein/ActR/RegA family two-component response regulator